MIKSSEQICHLYRALPRQDKLDPFIKFNWCKLLAYPLKEFNGDLTVKA